MSTVPQVSDAMQWVLNEYPRLIQKETGFVQRSTAKLDGPTFVRGLTLAWMAEPEASYAQLRNTIATYGVNVREQAIEQRFSPASVKLFKEVFKEAIKQVICAEVSVPGLIARFNGVYNQDSSIVTLPAFMAKSYPGCGGKGTEAGISSMRIEARWDLAQGGMSGPWITSGREAEHQGAAREEHLPEGSLFCGDGNYFILKSMKRRGEAGTFWLTPAKANLHFYDAQGIRRDLVSYLQSHNGEQVIDTPIQAGLSDRLPCRLIAVHLKREQRQMKASQTVYQPAGCKGVQACGPKKGKKGEKKKKKSRKKSTKMSKSRLKVSDWVFLVTNVPVEKLNAEEALVLMRCRWQIELLWKLWKQYGKIDAWRSEKPERIETEIYAKLLGLLIEHWITILGCWEDPKRSLRKAQQMTQFNASALGFALIGEMSLPRTIQRITEAMSNGCRINSRRKKPNTYQLVRDPKLINS